MLNKLKKSIIPVISIGIVLLNALITTEIISADEGRWGGGDGKAANTAYLIEDSLDLELLATNVNNGNEYKDTYFRMTKDIDLSKFKSDTGWIPIANNIYKFRGKFDGAGKKITGLYINSKDYYCGLFGFTSLGSEIKNLGVELLKDGGISGKGSVGGLVGTNDGGNIENCYVIGNITNNIKGNVGGLAGNHYSGDIKNCYTMGEVKSKGDRSNVGGLVGYGVKGNIENCFSESSVIACDLDEAGGFIGLNDSVNISRCYATGEVSGSGLSVGGFIGQNNEGIIKQCFAVGTVSSSQGHGSTGGLIGMNCGRVIECFASGSVTNSFDGKGTNNCGGLVGATNVYYDRKDYEFKIKNPELYKMQQRLPTSTGSISNSYATGIVRGGHNSYVGVLVSNGGAIENSYATGEAYCGEVQVGGLTGPKLNKNLSGGYWCIDDIDQKALQNTEEQGTGKRLTKLQMVGDSAQKNMDTLNFTEVWQTREADGNTHYFPQLKFFASSKASDKMRAASLASVSVVITDDKTDTKVISQPNIPAKEEKDINIGISYSIDLLKSDEACANVLQFILIYHIINPLIF